MLIARHQWKVKDMDEVALLHSGMEEFRILVHKTHGTTVNRKEAGIHRSLGLPAALLDWADPDRTSLAGLLMRRLGALWKECLYLAFIDDFPPFEHSPTIRVTADSTRTISSLEPHA